ncbi:MAG: glycoside hydrolase family 9 protein [Dysgonamonadaceae bacterium]|nr:glycoside hydrolase family 9 protein [Dysgonamonadaceae bacterium]
MHTFFRTIIHGFWILLFPVVSEGQSVSSNILIDQFGYLPHSVKTAVIKNPKTGFDASHSFTPGSIYRVVDAQTNQPVFEGTPVLFDNGATDAVSGDQIGWFDFSPVSTFGKYYILDVANHQKSYSFSINNTVYDEVLKHAVRMFFYQRAGFAKEARYAGVGWADGASHLKALQDKNCRLYNKKNDASTERDLHGGWFDAGDYNKYTNWAASYIETMLLAYLENPHAWADDYNLPDSGNGIPDLLDEARWGMDWLLRMQETDGSVLCVMGLSGGSPPSAVTGQSLYGPATTMATLSAVKVFALGYKVYNRFGMTGYAEKLREASLKAWEWAKKNPNVIFHNNSSSNGSSGLAAGDQEIEGTYNREAVRMTAAIYLYEMTGDRQYLSVFEDNYEVLPLIAWNNDMQQYWSANHFLCFYYFSLNGISETIKNSIANALKTAFNKPDNYAGKLGKDGYRAFIKDYNWGSNQYKSDYGTTFYFFADQSLEPDKNRLYADAAEDYLHYIHGVNPMGLVYLTNMNAYGASNSLTEIYHTWFCDKSIKWDKAGYSTYGPAPGYLAGGPNDKYHWDDCCPQACGSTGNNALCYSEPIPINQPAAKMYKDFNANWPLNSWEITEPMGAYQIAYIRLLSKYVARNPNNAIETVDILPEPEVFPNPARGSIHIRFMNETINRWELFDAQMHLLQKGKANGHVVQVHVPAFSANVYFLQITTERKSYLKQVIIGK